MKQNPDQFRLDQIAVRYLEATERGDLNTIADLWAAAASDLELEVLLHQLNEELTRVPISRRRPVWIGLAASVAAACLVVWIWRTSETQGGKAEKADPTVHLAPVASFVTPLASGSVPSVATSRPLRIAGLADDLEGADLPPFDWPFSELPIVKGSSPIPADLLN